ncbi:hypothetical protein ACHAPU_002992 [Fusarium lateritium]
MAPTTTTELDTNHKFWKCKQDIDHGHICGEINDIQLKQCRVCKARRDAGDEAMDSFMVTMGKLIRVDKNGTEHWQYDKA